MSQIHVAGSINMDVVVRVDRRPRLGETIVGEDVNFDLGGKGINQAIAASRLGSSVEMIGRIGTDEFGRQALDCIETEDISMEHVRQVEGSPTGMALITVDGNSENTIVIIPGANSELSEADVTSPSIQPTDIAVSQFEIPRPTVRSFFRSAKENDATTVLNPAPADTLTEPMSELVDYLVVNETEALAYSDIDGRPPLTRAEILEACRELRSHSGQTIVVTLGANGLLASTPSETIELDPYTVDTVDTTGAGDAFVGAFVSALEDGKSLKNVLDFANAAGAVATTSEGASKAVPTPPEIEDVLDL
jgi:ribokinase